MNPELKKHTEQLKAICRKYRFSKLWVFGSVLSTAFQKNSDIDFLYDLNHKSLDGKTSIEYFFAFQEEVEHLLGRPIDLVWYPGIRNPYFKEEVDESKILIYEEETEK
ncbi:MAG: nucleotidyltransferase domain-containing protein, partial [Bacteroidota bacterium]